MFDAGFGPELDRLLQVTTRDLSADGGGTDGGGGGGAVQHVAVGATHPATTLAMCAEAAFYF